MIICNKRNTRYDKIFKIFNNIPKSVYLLLFLIGITFPLYYKIINISEPSIEDKMKEYSKQVEANHLQIDIKFNNYQKLLYQRREALRSGGNSEWNYTVEFEEVPAKITFEGKEYKADISLKGLRKTHYLDSTRMSYQIKLKDGNTIMGMNRFSLHDPRMRNYIYEWIFHEFLKREGFIAMKYDFVQVKLNGTDAGVYAIEERPDKILLERYGYVDGPIFKLTDDNDLLFLNTVEPFISKKYSNDEWKEMTNKAEILARGLFEGRFKIGKSVNSDMLAKYFAICDVLMTYHGSLAKSIRLYFNPVTQKFEPIGFDGHFLPGSNNYISSEILQQIEKVSMYYNSLYGFQGVLFFNEKNYDREFLTAYAKYLNKFSSEEYIKDFFSKIDKELTQKTAVIYKNHPLLEDHANSFGPDEFSLSIKHINDQAAYIKQNLSFTKELSNNRLSLKIDNEEIGKNSLKLMVSNNYSLSIVLKEVMLNDSLKYYPSSDDFDIPYVNATVRNYKKYDFSGNQEIPQKIDNAKLAFCIAGIDSVHYLDISIFKDDLKIVMKDILRAEADLDDYKDVLSIECKDNIVRFKKGKHSIARQIKIPKGFKVIIEDGTEINLKDSAFILSYSPVYFNGSHTSPIKITSDRTGGIAVFDCDSTSYLKNVIFEGLSNPRSEEWKLTGSVTFYKSPVVIDSVKFYSNYSEDYLNIKLAKFDIINSLFKNVFSDAFDSDFSYGSISNSFFENLINDAVDVSGSDVDCRNLEIKNAGDKAFSSGEGSFINIENTKIFNSEIALASKDKSKISAKNLEITACKVGFTAYQKKSEYGCGEIVIEKYVIKGFQKEYLIEKGSSLILDNKLIMGDLIKVEDNYLYGKAYGKKSVK